MTDILTEWWWPSPDAFNDLEVTDIEEGWQLSAPDFTELAEWLNYWNQSEEHHALFQTVFVKTLTDHAELVIENYGKTEAITDQQSGDRSETQEVSTGALP
jgi:hypothetical protein